MYKFNKTSLNNLYTCHKDLRKIHLLAIKRTNIDYSITAGYRSVQMQRKLYEDGKDKCDGTIKKSKYNFNPSLATDICIYFPVENIREKIIYYTPSLSHVAGVVLCCAKELFAKKEISRLVRWGGNWNMNGIILLDQKFDDICHFKLWKP